MNPKIIYKSFQHDLDYASKTKTHIEHMTQFMFLIVIYQMPVPSMTHSLAENYAYSCRGPEKILQYCKKASLPDVLNHLNRFLHHYNMSNFKD